MDEGNAGEKRRFPSWMLGVSAADKVKKSDHVSNSKKVGKPILKSGSTDGDKEYMLEENTSSALKHCGTKRKSSRRSVDSDNENPKSDQSVSKSDSRKRRKRKSLRLQSIQESEILYQSDEDEEELSMEDLMSIANEYVTADKDAAEQQQLAKRECENGKENVLKGPYEYDVTALESKTTTSSHKSNVISKNEESFVRPSTTGDPAQDMLNLFLGPLLSEPVEKGKKHEVTTTVDDGMLYVSAYNEYSQNVAIGQEEEEEVVIPMKKKKSSLKDKVAMLLD